VEARVVGASERGSEFIFVSSEAPRSSEFIVVSSEAPMFSELEGAFSELEGAFSEFETGSSVVVGSGLGSVVVGSVVVDSELFIDPILELSVFVSSDAEFSIPALIAD
jgi:hypothetical protein